MHLQVGNEGVPIGDCAPTTRPRVIVYTSHTKGGWHERSGGFPVGTKRFAVEDYLGVELARSPTVEHFLQGGFVHAEQIGDGFEVGSKGDDATDVQVAVRPTVQAVSNTRRKGIVDRGVAQRTLNAHFDE